MATPASGTLNFFVQGVIPTPESSSFPFSLSASPSGVNANESSFPFFVNTAPAQSGSLNFFLAGTNIGAVQSHLNFFTRGLPLTGSFDFFLQNNYQAASSGIPFYVAVTGFRSAPTGSLNFYVQREPAASFPFFVKSPNVSTSGELNFTLPAGSSLSGGFNFAIPDTRGANSSSFNLWTSGF